VYVYIIAQVLPFVNQKERVLRIYNNTPKRIGWAGILLKDTTPSPQPGAIVMDGFGRSHHD
jgi:hypothetical protein